MVDLDHRTKQPCPISNTTFRPSPDAMAIINWTNKVNEPDLVFPKSQMKFFNFLWNLRISYPTQEIYIGDDDIRGAFHKPRYHPNVVALHTSVHCRKLVTNTGGTFGGNTSASNFEPWARARQQYAQHLWNCLTDTAFVAKYLPPLVLAAPPPATQKYSSATINILNPGVFCQGRQLPNPYPHHVDDNPYADIRQHFRATVLASICVLFCILGFPDDLR